MHIQKLQWHSSGFVFQTARQSEVQPPALTVLIRARWSWGSERQQKEPAWNSIQTERSCSNLLCIPLILSFLPKWCFIWYYEWWNPDSLQLCNDHMLNLKRKKGTLCLPIKCGIINRLIHIQACHSQGIETFIISMSSVDGADLK